MITKLMEGHDPLAMKPKAEQYWPDDGTTKFFPDTGLKVKHTEKNVLLILFKYIG